jgi:hypothetical protein
VCWSHATAALGAAGLCLLLLHHLPPFSKVVSFRVLRSLAECRVVCPVETAKADQTGRRRPIQWHGVGAPDRDERGLVW